MDPNFDKFTGLNLPQPVEGAPSPSSSGETISPAVETMHGAGERIAASSPPAAAAPLTPSMQPAVIPSLPTNIPVAADNTTVATPAVANDTDLIEKEWVNKAKQIVEQTREDPYSQSKELTKFKAEYMQKRYNKALKLSE